METMTQTTHLSEERRQLAELEKTGNYVFHGTTVDAEHLKPRQAISARRGLDGPPSVFASPRADYAIFMAIVSKKTAQGKGSFESSVNTEYEEQDKSFSLAFSATKETLDRITPDTTGWVYVFNKSDFYAPKDHPAEFRSEKPVRPAFKIRVTGKDLPETQYTMHHLL